MPPMDGADESEAILRASYDQRIAALRARFEENGDGAAFVQARSEAVDELLRALCLRATQGHPGLARGFAILALGGYGRGQLFPCSDIDLLFCTAKSPSTELTAAVRRISQTLWDFGMRASVSTRAVGDLERFKTSDPEGSLALLDLRLVAGDPEVHREAVARVHTKRSRREARSLSTVAAELTRERHARFGKTLFHLEPNLKDAPGGLRDAHVVRWLALLREDHQQGDLEGFEQAVAFLTSVRVFLHMRHGRDDNTLDWHVQNEAALKQVGLPPSAPPALEPGPDPAYWMRLYFRHARVIERVLDQNLEMSGLQARPTREALRAKVSPHAGVVVDGGLLRFKEPVPQLDPAADPSIVMGAFGLMAATGLRLQLTSQRRVVEAIPKLSAGLENGSLLWSQLRQILCGRYAGDALRAMHALGLLDLVVPEFHGIDALVIRDAYHRYTVDEHTFVLLDALHALADDPPAGAPEWRLRFKHLLETLAHPELLYLAALLHDTGKARSGAEHAQVSAQLASSLLGRLELDLGERDLVLRLIENHLEMSAALRRDIFDVETVRVFAERVGSHDLLRMLTLFTYADISAVHPDALTPWKAENLWRLWMAAENYLDRHAEEDHAQAGSALHGMQEAGSIARLLGLKAPQAAALERFLEGAPERYLRTRSPETIRQHMEVATRGDRVAVLLSSGSGSHEVTVITTDRPRLFADLTGALTGWGMNIVSAEAFSNAAGTVLDSFRFTDTYKTLELNPEERERFRSSLEAVVLGTVPIDALINRRRHARQSRPRRVVHTRIEFDNLSSAKSTLMQIVAQDKPGLLHNTSLLLSELGCSVEVALIDTEGEMAIDVFYLTLKGQKLDESEQLVLRQMLEAST